MKGAILFHYLSYRLSLTQHCPLWPKVVSVVKQVNHVIVLLTSALSNAVIMWLYKLLSRLHGTHGWGEDLEGLVQINVHLPKASWGNLCSSSHPLESSQTLLSTPHHLGEEVLYPLLPSPSLVTICTLTFGRSGELQSWYWWKEGRLLHLLASHCSHSKNAACFWDRATSWPKDVEESPVLLP